MVAQGLQGNSQVSSNFSRIFTFQEQPKYALFLVGEWRDGGWSPYSVSIRHRNDLLGNLKHIVKEFFLLFPLCDIARQVHDQAWVSSALFEDQG